MAESTKSPRPGEGSGEALSALLAWDVNQPMCPSRLILEHVTSRWGVLVLAALLERSYRFSELRRAVGGVSEKMLAQTLRTLERDGFVDRDAKPVIPPRVDYSLTPLGIEAAEQVWALARWTERRVDAVRAAREAYDGARA
ncbi:transcriptional regulator [Streptomyces sp. SID4928]|uniref:Transcriptional regulator n=2 Tax=Streptomyces TaxID=1883 RepID=B1W4W6_STRGG|nr:transcriptional regulator, HxlR family [Streptomyces sp. ACT-1]MBW3705401.1 transcriptional regulator [Streptomyces griseus]MYR50548.1 transcriptional regulator [Streptomyces sp. SID4928]BAG19760.1 putative transcriptional regulator [Streptomyces griseus subsp. griseus NBRC 13350]SEE87217.1 DNA-binding transcriptional regulator, HxlR family [Streptomyces griseus]